MHYVRVLLSSLVARLAYAAAPADEKKSPAGPICQPPTLTHPLTYPSNIFSGTYSSTKSGLEPLTWAYRVGCSTSTAVGQDPGGGL